MKNVFEYDSDSTDPPPKKVKPLKVPLRLAEPVPEADSVGDPQSSKNEDASESSRSATQLGKAEEDEEGDSDDADYIDFPLETTPVSKSSVNTSILQPGSIGLQMMQKMGFKIGETLGQSPSGIIEPLKPKAKTSRAGIGSTTFTESDVRASNVSLSAFRNSKKETHNTTRQRNMVLRLQRYCYHASGQEQAVADGGLLEEVDLMWRSYAALVTGTENTWEDEFDGKPIEEQLSLLLRRCRDVYFYCPYCSIEYENAEDMRSCPGESAEDHFDSPI